MRHSTAYVRRSIGSGLITGGSVAGLASIDGTGVGSALRAGGFLRAEDCAGRSQHTVRRSTRAPAEKRIQFRVYTTIVTRIPGRFFLKNLVERRALVGQLVRRDFEQRYVGSAAGWLWGLVHPVVLLGS